MRLASHGHKIGLGAAVALLLAGCGSDPSDPAEGADDTPTSKPSASSTSNSGGPAEHEINMTNIETTDPSLLTAKGKLSGTPFGPGTGVFRLVTPTNTTFVFTFEDGTLRGSVVGNGTNVKAVFKRGTGAYASIEPTPFKITVGKISGMTVTYTFTGSITY